MNQKKHCYVHLLLCTFFLFFSLLHLGAQQADQVTGTVVDESSQPLEGVSIQLKGSNRTVITDVNGIFKINAPRNAKLVITSVNYESQEITITQPVLTIVLKQKISEMEQIVVVGYGSVKKSDVTGAITKIGEKEMKAMPVQNALQAMQGKTAGVDITSNERPGEIGSIRIRGERSLNATNAPLYVVDGIPLQGTGIENLNPIDIESIEVLKDASATAIYGSRGANGVVLVTTKKGTNGKLSLNYSGTLSVENMYDRMQMMNSEEWLNYSRAAKIRAGTYNGSTVISQANDKAVYGSDPYAWAQIEKGWASGTWNGSAVPTYD